MHTQPSPTSVEEVVSELTTLTAQGQSFEFFIPESLTLGGRAVPEPTECYVFKQVLPFDDARWRAFYWYDRYDSGRRSWIDSLRIRGAGLGLWKPPVTEGASTGWIER